MTQREFDQIKTYLTEFEQCLANNDDKTAEAVVYRMIDLQFMVSERERENTPVDYSDTIYIADRVDELDIRLHAWRKQQSNTLKNAQ